MYVIAFWDSWFLLTAIPIARDLPWDCWSVLINLPGVRLWARPEGLLKVLLGVLPGGLVGSLPVVWSRALGTTLSMLPLLEFSNKAAAFWDGMRCRWLGRMLSVSPLLTVRGWGTSERYSFSAYASVASASPIAYWDFALSLFLLAVVSLINFAVMVWRYAELGNRRAIVRNTFSILKL
jgi:hypothetical protein